MTILISSPSTVRCRVPWAAWRAQANGLHFAVSFRTFTANVCWILAAALAGIADTHASKEQVTSLEWICLRTCWSGRERILRTLQSSIDVVQLRTSIFGP